jgi:malate dehydrogenase
VELLIALVLEHLSMALGKPANDISAMVIGSRWLMIPLTRLAYNGIPVSQFLSEEALKSSCRYYGGATLQVF